MSDTPDPPPVSPDIRSWANAFFAAIGWAERSPEDIAREQANAAAEAAFDAIADFRATRHITDSKGGAGTVSITEVDGQRYIGVNSENFDEADRERARQWEGTLGIQAGRPGSFARQALYHAEAHTLMQIYENTDGEMPAELTLYVDRIACSSCQNTLPIIISAMGIETLTIRLAKGRIATVTEEGFVGDWQQ